MNQGAREVGWRGTQSSRPIKAGSAGGRRAEVPWGWKDSSSFSVPRFPED